MSTHRSGCASAALLVIALTNPSVAQDAPKTTVANDAAAHAAAALEKCGANVVLRGKVSRRDSSEKQGSDGTTIVTVNGSDESKPFTGEIEVLRPRPGELLICSKKSVPGVVVYEADEARLVQTTCSDEPVGTTQLAADLVGLLDLPKLARTVGKQETKVERDEKTGVTSYRCTLPKGWLRQATGIADMFKSKVLAVQAVVRVDGKQKLCGLCFEVLHSDPTGSICEQARNGQLTTQTMTLDEATKLEDREGATTIYDLTIASGPAAARTSAALETMRKALAEEGR